jgi:7-cyano-7-deazaguanine synthase in queuosine biosynthesis
MSDATNILWTGGWDSTYRVLHLVMVEKKVVQPHYIFDTARRSSPRELQAISEIKQELKRIDGDAFGRLRKTNITSITEIPEYPEISEAYQSLRAMAPLGGQYNWLARYAKSEGINHIELCVELSENSKAYYFLKGNLIKSINGQYELKDNVHKDLKIFSYYSFPVVDLTKLEMKAQAAQQGFINALEKSWFCFNPIHGAPCGTCNPCISTIEDGMQYRFPRASIRRYRMRHIKKALKAPSWIARRVRAGSQKLGWA